MGLAYDGLTALAIIRARRSAHKRLGMRMGLASPSLTEGSRWTPARVSPERFCAQPPGSKVHVAVPNRDERIRTRGVESVVHSAGILEDAFIDLGDGFSCAGPELVFAEMGSSMSLAVQVMVGMELCGTFSRDPADPRMGPVAYGLEPVTSVERIAKFVDSAKFISGLAQSRVALDYVAENAWSPAEATIATLAALPVHEFGYDLGEVRLNVRTEAEAQLRDVGAKASRVPDILFGGTPVGINYDGRGHLDLDGLAANAQDGAEALDELKRDIRRKVVDDLRRTRELAAAGLVVLPATSEDLFERGGFDALMLEVMCAIERFAGRDLSSQRTALAAPGLVRGRQRLVWSLLPWAEATNHAREMLALERQATAGAYVLG